MMAAAAAEVRGSATGTRQFDSLVSGMHVSSKVHAVVLAGGSGYGLAAADPVKGEAVFAKCAACHTIASGGANGIGLAATQVDVHERLIVIDVSELHDQPLVLVQVHPNALTLYPAETWRGVEERLRELLRLQPSSRGYVLSVTANAVEVVPDKQGRILVPQRMQKEVGITGPTLIVGAIDRIELWNPETFDAVTGQAVPDVELLAHEIFA